MKVKLPVYNTIIYILIIALGCDGCAQLPVLKKNTTILKSPEPAMYTTIDSLVYNDGQSKNSQPWIVFSDRANNTTQAGIYNDVISKQLDFLQPLYVMKSKNNMVQVVHALPGIDLQATNGLIPVNKIKYCGWIPKDRLLLWTNAMNNARSGFSTKAMITVHNDAGIQESKHYFGNDSLLTFKSPNLIEATTTKVCNGDLVYIFKQSEDKKAFLIGKAPTLKTDSANQCIYGWISSQVLKIWGDRTAIRIKDDTKDLNSHSIEARYVYKVPCEKNAVPEVLFPISDFPGRDQLEQILPLTDKPSHNEPIRTKVLYNILDYSGNWIYNVLGDSIFYNDYKQLIRNNKKLNVVFVIDYSENNSLYLPVVKSLLQDLRLYFESAAYFSSSRFGAVVYKENACGINQLTCPLSNNYRDILAFFNKKEKELKCNDHSIFQPASEGLLNASRLLSDTEHETNVIIQIGTTADETNYDKLRKLIAAVTNVRARLIFFQTVAKSADAYNDYVLFAEKIVSNSAQNIAELKKEKIADQADVLLNSDFSLQTGDSGIYKLDYPTKSMSQGYVIFPQKGTAMLPIILKQSIDSLLSEIIDDNNKVESSLGKYFKSPLGLSNTQLKPPFICDYTNVSNPVPVDFSVQYANQSNPFLIDGLLPKEFDPASGEYGILLTDAEFEKIQRLYRTVYEQTIVAQNNFKQKKAVRRYIKILKQNNPTEKKLSKRFLRKQKLEYASSLTSGFISTDSFLLNNSIKMLSKKKIIAAEDCRIYFKNFKTIADNMMTQKGNNAIRIPWKGNYYYWLNESFIPTVQKPQDVPVIQ